MTKLDQLRREAAANVDESMGAGRPAAPIPGESGAPARPGSGKLRGAVRSTNACEILLDRIVPDPDQPREEFEPEALERLAASIRSRGVLQPIRVRWDEALDAYVIIAGERRWRATKMARLASIPCVVHDRPIGAAELFALQVVENCLREDLRPIEQAKAFRSLMDRNGWSGNRLADELGISQPSVVKALALLKLPDPVQDLVEREQLPAAAAYELSKLGDPAAQAEVAARAAREGLSRDEVAKAVRSRAPRKGRAGKPRKVTERSFKTTAGPKVVVEYRKGLDPATARAALLEAVALLDSEAKAAAA